MGYSSRQMLVPIEPVVITRMLTISVLVSDLIEMSVKRLVVFQQKVLGAAIDIELRSLRRQ